MLCRLLLPAVVGLTLGSCILFQEDAIAVWADRPQYVSYIDYYNTTGESRAAHFRYVEQIFPERIPAHEAPDVIIARHISYQDAKRTLRPLTKSIINGNGGETAFYYNVFAAGTIGNSQRAIPLAFNLPILVFNAAQELQSASVAPLTIDRIKNEGERLNERRAERIERIGFAPQWDTHFLYLGTKIYGADYREDRQQGARWNEDSIFEVLRYFRSWNNDIDASELAQFTDRYIHPPLYDRINDQRIGFFISDLVQYSKLAPEQREQTDFLPLASAQGLLINEDMTFIAIHRNAKNPALAEDFVRWILTEQTQSVLIRHTRDHNINMFGFAGGLSTIKNISVRAIPQYHPWLIGNVPDVSAAATVVPLPKHWHRIRSEVIEPWLQNVLRGNSQESLENEIIKWRKREEFQ